MFHFNWLFRSTIRGNSCSQFINIIDLNDSTFSTLFQLVGAEANKKIADLRDWDVDTNVPESDVLMQKTNIFYFMFFYISQARWTRLHRGFCMNSARVIKSKWASRAMSVKWYTKSREKKSTPNPSQHPTLVNSIQHCRTVAARK